jgi:Flp pilus assembly pilin Flp
MLFTPLRGLIRLAPAIFMVREKRIPGMSGNIARSESTLRLQELGTNYLGHGGEGAMGHNTLNHQKGQNIIEYAIVVALVASAMLAMSTYVFRSVQATQQVISEGFND